MRNKLLVVVGVVLVSNALVQAATNTWDNDSGDGLWTTATNWSLDVVPAAGDVLNIANGDTVDFNAGVQLLPAACTINLTGGSVLTEDVVIRLNGSTINVASGSSLTGGFWDLLNGTLVFNDGAAAGMANWEQKGNNTFRFNLGGAGFTTLTPATFRLGGGATMSNATYIVDMGSYTGAMNTIKLVDFSVNAAGVTAETFQWATLIITNAGVYTNAFIEFDGSATVIQVAFPPLPVTWDGGGADDSWTTGDNWNPDGVPGADDEVLVGLNASVTNATADFASLKVEAGASVMFSNLLNGTLSGKDLVVEGTLSFPGVFRPSGCTIDLSGSFGSQITFMDVRGGTTINFADGSAFGNTAMNFQQRDNPTFGYALSASGFSTLQAGGLFGPAPWSNVTYNIDISAYDFSNGLSIVLADYTSHENLYNGAFDPTVNIISGGSGLGAVLSFDTTFSRLILGIDPPGNQPPVAHDQSVPVPTNGPVNFTLSATDIEGSNLTYSIISHPTNGILSGTAPDLTYTPTGGVFVFDAFTFTAFDGEDVSNTGTVTMARIPYSDNELWATYHDAILSDPLNTEWLTNWVENGISMWQIRYDLGPLTGTRTNASPKIAAYYAYPASGTNLPGLVQIHGGGQRASASLAKYWAGEGYAAISINWGALPLLDGQPNTDWDGLPAGFLRDGVTNAIFHNWCDADVYDDGATLYDISHPLNSSWTLNSYAGRRALTFLTAQSQVDANKLGVVGWSMGGNTTVKVATDPRITAIVPGVGGTGFLYEDWWGLPGSARSTNGVDDVDLFIRTVDSQSYWPDITAATLYLEAANDFNAPFDLVIKALSLQDTNVEQRLAVSPHFNHRNWPDAEASKKLWMKTHLAGTFDFPDRSTAELDLTHPDGIPRFRVWPDESTAHPVVAVDIYYGIERDSRIRFWRDAGAVETNGYWEAPCPVYDVNEMLAAMAIVTYDAGFTLTLPPGYPGTDSVFSVASDVHLVYPPELENSGITATAQKQRVIDDFSRAYKDWWYLNANNTELWQFWTRKPGDPSWRGPAGGELAVDVVTTAAGNTLGIVLDTKQWNGTDATTFKATAAVSAAGTNHVSLPVSAFTNGNGVALTTWDDVKHLSLQAGNMVDGSLPAWSGSIPVFQNLRWEGGEWMFTNGVSSTWLEQYGLDLNDASALSDTDLDSFLNWQELIAGTVPTNDQSGLWMTQFVNDANELVIEWSSVNGKSYLIGSRSNLLEAAEATEAAGIVGMEPSNMYTVTVDRAEAFYHVTVQ